ncbi:hypothetical protein [Rufibacter tibetensis]|uniref:Uncharacterized protein n=1 Tax=Rufibacter tibetensis TaxID=512763 RepID=A0A0P0CYU3_9BACT|nr:hypothetical protein [Rufibacter tibetensis]ALI99894.1 hypothetical protein DC20_14085 [Rufibacter tibetensis]
MEIAIWAISYNLYGSGIQKEDINLLQATAEGTFPTSKDYQHKKTNLRGVMEYTLFDFIPKNASKIDRVILGGMQDETSRMTQDSVLYGLQETIRYLKKLQDTRHNNKPDRALHRSIP